MTNGRTKGASAEREVAKLVESWWRQLEPDCRFVKTPLSGGWSTPQVRTEFRASGDLMTTAQRFPFVIEVKRREAFSWETLMFGNRRSPVWGWWTQAVKAAQELDGQPMLWLRRNREPWRIVLAHDALPPGSCSPRFRTTLLSVLHGKLELLPAAAVLTIPPETLVR